MISNVGVIVHRGKAYVPTYAKMTGEMAGAYLTIEPIYVTNLTLDELTETLERVVAAGNPEVPTPTREELERYYSRLLLRAAGVRSWRQLAREGASYGIGWLNNQIELTMSRLDKQGRWEIDPTKTRYFPRDTDIRTIVEAILQDVRSRPELLASDTKP
jgi:hypothetical protein